MLKYNIINAVFKCIGGAASEIGAAGKIKAECL
jgi:hypothetical protein